MGQKTREAYSARQRAELLLSNLEKLKAEGSVGEAQYQTLRADYCKMRDNAISEIESIEAQLQKESDDKAHELEARRQELADVKARLEVGEIGDKSYRKQKKRLDREVAKLEGNQAAAKPGWFARHLNWTLAFGCFLGLVLAALQFLNYFLNYLLPRSDYIIGVQDLHFELGLLAAATWLGITGWVLKQKGRTLWWLALVVVTLPFFRFLPYPTLIGGVVVLAIGLAKNKKATDSGEMPEPEEYEVEEAQPSDPLG